MDWRSLRAIRRAVVMLTIGALTLASASAVAVPAQAESGDFAKNRELAPGTTDWGTFHFFIELEAWSEEGTAACVGDGTGSGNGSGSWYHDVCDGNGPPPDEVYCFEACYGTSGVDFVHNHSSVYYDKFWGWFYNG